MKKLRLLLLTSSLTLSTSITSFAAIPYYSSYDELTKSYTGGYNKLDIASISHAVVQSWTTAGYKLPNSGTKYITNDILHICQSGGSTVVAIGNKYNKVYLRVNDDFVAEVTSSSYNAGTYTTDFTYYLGHATYSASLSRKGTYFRTTAYNNTTNTGTVSTTIKDKDSIAYYGVGHGVDSNRSIKGTITFRIAHSTNGSWCERIGGERICA